MAEKKSPSVESLHALIERYRLTLSDLKDEIGSKSSVSMILAGKRNLTKAHIGKLSARFQINPAVFFDPVESRIFVGRRTPVPRRDLLDPQVEPEDQAQEALLANVAIKANRKARKGQQALMQDLHAAIQRAVGGER